jgi:hypothetical protein
LDLEDLKIQWFNRDSEELPSWINAHFDVGALGAVSGRVTETNLSGDGSDEDGDPYGFDTNVFETADGTLKDLSVGRDSFSFTVVYPGKDGGQVAYSGRREGSAAGAWTLHAASRSSKGDSAGHNRFPLTSEEKKEGQLEIYTQTEDTDSKDTQSL